MLGALSALLAGAEQSRTDGPEGAGENPASSIVLRSDWRAFAVPGDFRLDKGDRRDASSRPISRVPRLGIDFSRACKEVFTIELDAANALVAVKQLPEEESQLGAVVWDCGVVLCRVLNRLTSRLGGAWLEYALVVELGSGTGLVGLCAARLGARRVVLSDLTALRTLLDENRARNSDTAPRVQVCDYSWGSPSPPSFARQDAEDFRLVLCSDVLYATAAHPQLLQTLDALVDASTAVLLSVKYRDTSYVS